MSSLLSSQEAIAFNGFLASVNSSDIFDTESWSAVTSLADQLIQPPKGKETLARATKDLMSMQAPVLSDPPPSSKSSTPHPSNTPYTTASNWPAFAPEGPQPHHQNQLPDSHLRQTHSYTYGFGGGPTSQSSNSNPPLSYSIFNDPSPSNQHHRPSPQQAHSDPSLHQPGRASPSSPFVLPPVPDVTRASQPFFQQPPLYSSQDRVQPSPNDHLNAGLSSSSSTHSIPPLVHRSSSSKRSHTSQDSHPDDVTGPSLKRRRPSASTTASTGTLTPSSLNPNYTHKSRSTSSTGASSSTTRPSSSSPSTVLQRLSPPPNPLVAPAPTRELQIQTQLLNGSIPAPPSANGNANRQTLLSPSQKRANHIQSEQKRRANIRRGYEALCDVVPALKEAIQAEEKANGVDDSSRKGAQSSSAANGKKKKKGGKGGGDDDAGLDGRAGPRSENVVLQKTIDHLTALLAERATLSQRLTYARSLLPSNHPSLPVDQAGLDETGLPLWEREWGGGHGWGEDDGGGDGP